MSCTFHLKLLASMGAEYSAWILRMLMHAYPGHCITPPAELSRTFQRNWTVAIRLSGANFHCGGMDPSQLQRDYDGQTVRLDPTRMGGRVLSIIIMSVIMDGGVMGNKHQHVQMETKIQHSETLYIWYIHKVDSQIVLASQLAIKIYKSGSIYIAIRFNIAFNSS